MKKLLAIAVAVAVTAPVIADTSVYGSARGLIQQDGNYGTLGGGLTPLVPNSDDLTFSNNGSRFGIKGSNAIDNGLSMTHKMELRGDITGTNNSVSTASMNIGLKGGFGHVQLGQMDTVMDDVDGGATFLTNGHNAAHTSDGNSDAQIKYTGAFGPITAYASTRLKGNQGGVGTTKSQLGLTYKAGPFKVGVATANNVGPTPAATDLSDLTKTKVALSYAGSNYGVGLVHSVSDNTTKYKATTLGGKYGFGKAYVAAAIGKGKIGPGKIKHNSFEVGYGLGKGTKVYLESKSVKTNGGAPNVIKKSTGLGFQHDF